MAEQQLVTPDPAAVLDPATLTIHNRAAGLTQGAGRVGLRLASGRARALLGDAA